MDFCTTYALLNDLFFSAGKNEKVCFWSKKTGHREYHQVEFLKNEKNLYYVLKKFPDEDAFFSMNTFKNCRRAHTQTKDLFNVYAFCIDVDYKNGADAACSVKEAIACFQSFCITNGFLQPSYIEYGNQFRLIYFIRGHLSGESQFAAIRLVMDHMVDTLNHFPNFDFCAESQSLSSFLRIPGSKNTKTCLSGHWVVSGEDVIYRTKHYPEICLLKTAGTPLSLSDYMTEILGKWTKPDWYDSWKQKQESENSKRTQNPAELNRSRLEDISVLQTYLNGTRIGVRDKLCFLHFIHAKALFQNNEKAFTSMQEFNTRFSFPLKENELRNVVCSAWHTNYFYRSEKLLAFLDVSEEEAKMLGLHMTKKNNNNKRNCKKYYEKQRKALKKQKKTKKQQILRKKKSIIKLRRKGKKTKWIAKSLNLSQKTCERYISELIKEHKIIRPKLQKSCKEVICAKKEKKVLQDFCKSCEIIGKKAEQVGENTIFNDLNKFVRLYEKLCVPRGKPGFYIPKGVWEL